MAEVPAAVVTVMSTVPVPGRAGDASMMILPAVFDEMVAAAVPKSTAVAEVRFVPVIVTLVPPAGSPDEGAIEVIVGDSCCGGGRHPDEGQRHPEGAQAQSQRERPLYETHRTHNQRVQPTLGHRTPPLGLSASRLHPSATSPGAKPLSRDRPTPPPDNAAD